MSVTGKRTNLTKGITIAGGLAALLLVQACEREEVLDNQNLDTEFSEQNQQNQPGQDEQFESEGAFDIEPGPLEEGAPFEENDPGQGGIGD